MLTDVEAGTEIFVDANIFLYDILEHWKYGEACKTFLEYVNRGKYSGLTFVLVCNEVFHRTMIAESNDAIHATTMKRYGITNIATNDPDFERVSGIKVWKP
jgi:predicted nucleic acid-binding protein